MTAPTKTDDPLKGLSKRKKTVLIVGGAVVVGYVVYRYRQDQAAMATPSDASATTGGTGSGSRGYSPAPGLWRYRPWRPYRRPPRVPHEPPPITTDPEWAQEVVKGLHQRGYSRQAVAAALALWFAHESMTAHEAELIHIAVALYGDPPHNPGPPKVRHHRPHHNHHRGEITGSFEAAQSNGAGEFPDAESAQAIRQLTGFYRVLPSGQVIHVVNSERYLVRPETLAGMRPRPHMQYITPLNEINRLPIGGYL